MTSAYNKCFKAEIPSLLIVVGDALLSGCLSGYYGVGCQSQCNCSSDVSCDAVTGACQCPAGRHGLHCQQGYCQSRRVVTVGGTEQLPLPINF